MEIVGEEVERRFNSKTLKAIENAKKNNGFLIHNIHELIYDIKAREKKVLRLTPKTLKLIQRAGSNNILFCKDFDDYKRKMQ